jgi:hypothetical protein
MTNLQSIRLANGSIIDAGSGQPFGPIAAKPVGNRGVFVIMVNET